MKIGSLDLNNTNVTVIAEAGVNHNGDMNIAKKLIESAANSGAKIIKFQTYKAEKLTTKNAPKFWDWKDDHASNQFESYSTLDSFGKAEYTSLKLMCDDNGIEFMSTPFDFEAVDMLFSLGVRAFKIASCDITNLEFIHYISKTNLPIFLSTGASEIDEIKTALEFLGDSEVCIMHCTLCYPTEIKDSNLLAILDLKSHFPEKLIGLSDHTRGTLVASTSVALGVRVIEKHFTIDNQLLLSPDHAFANNATELAELVNNSNQVLLSLGEPGKKVLECEIPARKYARRSVVAERDIALGEVFTRQNISIKRPGTGLAPISMLQILGRTASRQILKDELLDWNSIESH